MNFKLWNIFRDGVFVGSLRSLNEATACREYSEWANCDVKSLRAEMAAA